MNDKKNMKNKVSLATLMKEGQGFTDFKIPAMCGDFDFIIQKDGTWLYQNSPIGRIKMVQLFATVLQKIDNEYWLITPAEKGKIVVQDAPFFMVQLDVENTGKENQSIQFRSTLDWWVTADEIHNIWVEVNEKTGEPNPYIMVRDGLHARISRSCFYEMCDLAEPVENNEGKTELVLTSNGASFSLGII